MKYTFIFLSFAFILEKNINFLYYTKRLCIVKKAEFLYNNEDYTFQKGACKIMLLLLVIYIAFIGVGIPETLIGAAWPAVYTEWGLPESWLSFVTIIIPGCIVLSGALSSRALNKFGTYKVTVFSIAMTALALLGYAMAPNFWWFCVLAVPLGLGAGAINTGLNNYVALHYTATHMNFLHCFYGLGITGCLSLMSLALSDNNWRAGYIYAFLVQVVIVTLFTLSFKLWKKGEADIQAEEQTKNLSAKEMLLTPGLWIVWIIMLATNGIECVCGNWCSTYLVETKGFTGGQGALTMTCYYVGLTLGRFLSGALASKVKTWNRIYISCGILAVALIMLLLPGGTVLSVAGVFLVGLGNSSIYPNFIYLTPYNFGKDISQAVMGSQVAFAFTGVMLFPPLFGLFVQMGGIFSFPLFMTVLFAVMAAAIWVFVKKAKISGKYNPNV